MVIIRERVDGTRYDAFVYANGHNFRDFTSRLLQTMVRVYPESRVESHQISVTDFLESVRSGGIIVDNPLIPRDYKFQINNGVFSGEIRNSGIAFYWRSIRH